MFKTELAASIFEFWNLNEAQKEELFSPKKKVLQQESFTSFLKNAENLMIAGDYDADGVMATSIAAKLAEKMDIAYGYYIPNRLKEGYGLSEKTVSMAHERGYTDLLLVDNGVKAQKALQKALDYGMRVAVVDHHLIEDELSEEILWYHPELIEDPYFKDMSAAGLLYALAESMGLEDPYLASLAAVATVADVMPLWGKNREIVRTGLDALNRYRFAQFEYLVNARYLKYYTAEVIAFQISPKINAMGRLSDIANINTAVRYFLSQNPQVIKDFSKQVLSLNNQRKEMSKEQEEIALSLMSDDPVQVIVHPSFHEGLLGIIANKVSEKSQKPSILLKPYETMYKGSARSMSHSLSELFSFVSDEHFVQKGGHDFAYGMTVKKDALAHLKQDLNKAISKVTLMEERQDALLINAEWLKPEALEELRFFEPFGEAFQLPNLEIPLTESFRVYRMNGYGYKMRFKDFEAVYFSPKHSYEEVSNARSILCRLDMQSKYGLQVYVEDIR